MRGPPTHAVDMQRSKRRRIRLCSWARKAKGAFCSCVAWGWRLYNIVESESDPLTRRPVNALTFSKKNPSRANGRSTYIHPPSLAKIRQTTSEEIGNTQTHTQTNKRCSNYSMIWSHLCWGLMCVRPVSLKHGLVGWEVKQDNTWIKW